MKHRFIEVDTEGNLIRKFLSKEFDVGTVPIGSKIRFKGGDTYKVLDLVIDCDLPYPSTPELHVELLKQEAGGE